MKDCSSGAPLSYNGVSNPLAKENGNDDTRHCLACQLHLLRKARMPP